MIAVRLMFFEALTKLRIPLASTNVQAGFLSPAEDYMNNSLDRMRSNSTGDAAPV